MNPVMASTAQCEDVRLVHDAPTPSTSQHLVNIDSLNVTTMSSVDPCDAFSRFTARMLAQVVGDKLCSLTIQSCSLLRHSTYRCSAFEL